MSAYEVRDDGRSDYASSRYYDERRHQRESRHTESRDRDRDSYARSQVTSRDLVPRTREDSDFSVEEIHRDFPPPTYSRDPYHDHDDDRRSRSSRDIDRDYDRREGKKSRSSGYYDEERKRRRMISNQEKILAAVIGGALAVGGKELYDRREANQEGHGIHRNALSSAALGAAGAFAAYQGADLYNKHAAKEDRKALVAQKGRGSLYSDDDSDEDPKEKKGHKNFLENALAAAGLGGAVQALTGGNSSHDDRRSDSRSRRGDSRSRSGSRGNVGGTNKIQKAAMASLIAGATEAFRVAKEPGGWKGEKAKRILTAAAGAATIDAAQDDKHSKLGLAESVIGGLLGNRIVNGSRRNIEEDRRTGRSRSRSRSRSQSAGGGGVSGLAALATAGLGALGAKKIADSHERSRSRRRNSVDSDRSHRSRSRSVVDSARRSLSKLGIGNDPDDDYRDESPRHKSSPSRHRRRYDSADTRDDYASDRRRGDHDRERNQSRDRDYDDDDRSVRRRGGSRSHRDKGGLRSDSDSDLGSSSGDEKRAKKMRDGRHRH